MMKLLEYYIKEYKLNFVNKLEPYSFSYFYKLQNFGYLLE